MDIEVKDILELIIYFCFMINKLLPVLLNDPITKQTVYSKSRCQICNKFVIVLWFTSVF